MTNRFKILYLDIANSDMEQIFDYILKDNPSEALKILNEIDQSVSKLSSFPNLGRIPKDDRLKSLGYRVLVISNYLVFYIIKENFIEIHRVLHGSRDYSRLL